MPKKKAIRPGPGATASVLTRMMKPPVASMVGDKKHRSRVVIVDCVEEKGKYRYSFHLEGSDEAELFTASCKFVKILEEGDPSLFFEEIESTNRKSKRNVNSNNDGFKEPKIKWEKSRARKLLYNDVKEGKVPLEAMEDGKQTTDYTQVYMMHPEYAEWDFDRLPSRLAGIRKIIKNKNGRAADDKAAFDKFVKNNPVSTLSHYGYIQWQGSDA